MALAAMSGSILQLLSRTRFFPLPGAMSSPAVEPPFSAVTMMGLFGSASQRPTYAACDATTLPAVHGFLQEHVAPERRYTSYHNEGLK